MAGIDDEIGGFIDQHFDTGSNDTGSNDNTQVADNTVQPQQGGARDAGFHDDFAADIKAAQNEAKTNGKQEQQPQQSKEGQQPKQVDQTAKPNTLRPVRGGDFMDNEGNIVDKDGRILARKGSEARMRGNLVTAREELTRAQARIQELESTSVNSQALNGLPAKLGLNNDDVVKALDLAAKVGRGQVLEVAREVLAMCVAQGHNVSDLLGNDVGDSIEMRAIQQMLDKRLAPVTQQQEQSQRETVAMQAAKKNYETFVSQNEYADIHGDDIALVMQAEGLNPQQAYNKLMHFIYTNNLDPAAPLEPQVLALQAARAKQPQQQQQQRQVLTPKPMINGGRSAGPAAATTQTMFGADDDWASIIKQVQATQ